VLRAGSPHLQRVEQRAKQKQVLGFDWQASFESIQDMVGVIAKNNRPFVEAVMYRYRAGIPWRDLPKGSSGNS
jgi:hypothetical protein